MQDDGDGLSAQAQREELEQQGDHDGVGEIVWRYLDLLSTDDLISQLRMRLIWALLGCIGAQDCISVG